MMSLGKIALWTRGHLTGDDVDVSGFAIDSRRVQAGELFVAIVGEHVDGHDYLADAQARGAVAALVTRQIESDFPQVLVTDATLALGDLRQRGACTTKCPRRRHHRLQRQDHGEDAGCGSILSRQGRTHVSAGNQNNELGLPLSVLAMPEDAEFAVLEMGAGKPGDIAYLAAIARPDIGLVTLIAPAHLERMGSIEGVAETKGALYQSPAYRWRCHHQCRRRVRDLFWWPGGRTPTVALRPAAWRRRRRGHHRGNVGHVAFRVEYAGR